MKKEVSFGILGCGAIAQRHAKCIAEAEKAVLQCCFDKQADRSEHLANAYGISAAANEVDFFSQAIDVVSICTPSGLHASHAIAALKAGKHVLIEKPMALNSESARAIINAAKHANKKVFIVKQNRFNAPVQWVKRLIDHNELGKIQLIQVSCFWNRGERYYAESDWKGKVAMDGGILFNQFSHFVDILYYLFGGLEITSALVSNQLHPYIEFEDNCVFSFKTKTGALGNFAATTNSYLRNLEGSLTIIAEKGQLKIGGKYLNELTFCEVQGHEVPDFGNTGMANQYGHYEGSMSNHHLVYANVIDAILNNGTTINSAEEGLAVVEIIENVYKLAVSAHASPHKGQ